MALPEYANPSFKALCCIKEKVKVKKPVGNKISCK